MIDQQTANQLDEYIERNLERYLDELSALCAQPSVSAQNLGIQETAEFVKEMLVARGLKSESSFGRRTSGRLRGDRRRRRQHYHLLQSLRRSAAGTSRPLGNSSVRTEHQGRQDVRPGRVG